MALTQEAILNTLLEGGGKVKNSELLSKFKDQLNCCDPAEKRQNRELFKTCVNNIAVVKDFQETKYIVLKKVYQHLLSDENARGSEEGEKERRHGSQKSESKDPELSPIEFALERCKNVDFKPTKALLFTVPLKSDKDEKQARSKPCALPLRTPQVEVSQRYKMADPERYKMADSEHYKMADPERYKMADHERKQTSTDGADASPQFRRHFKTPKPPDEPKYIPLDPSEHAWLVKSASGQWNQAYGLLLKDAQLAEKRDLTSGFTALHWAAKFGNTDMVCRIIDVSRKGGHGVDVDAKSNGGYTALHMACIHNHSALIDLLVRRYAANGNIRDNCGKKPYHYLRKDASGELRELLGEPKAVPQEDGDPHRHMKSRLFPPHPVGIKKKNKARMQFMSVAEDDRAERDEPASHKQRLVSNVFP